MRLPLVLASGSPRRADLLHSRKIPFETYAPEIEELVDPVLRPAQIAVVNATGKALEVARQFCGRVVLGADTVVALRGKTYGKPDSLAAAGEMLLELSGNTHEVITAVHLQFFPSGAAEQEKACRFFEVTRVRFRAFGIREVREYFCDVNPLDKAGSYSAQEDRGRLIECIEGCRDNVVGLPVDRVVQALRKHFSGVVAEEAG